MRIVKLLVVLVAVVFAFCSGYALSSWRAYGRILPALGASHSLSDALRSAQIAEVIDTGDAEKARVKLLLVANVERQQFEQQLPAPGLPQSLKWFFAAPFEDTDTVLVMMTNSDASRRAQLEQLMTKLCSTSPQTDGYRHACNR